MFGRSVRATSEEARRWLPGDELIAPPIGSLTHAATIRRLPSDVWPWIAQMGAGSRAGWYSYDVLDNGGRPSAERIVPELQQLSAGMTFPALPSMADGFILLAFEPDRLLILGWRSPNDTLRMTWAFVLHEMADRTTRLIVRVRAGRGYQFHRLAGLPAVRRACRALRRRSRRFLHERSPLHSPLVSRVMPVSGSANAVIGIDIDYEVLGQSNGMLMVSVSGIAVVC